MIRQFWKFYAFIERDMLQVASYRLAFLLQIVGMFFSLLVFFFMTKMMNPNAPGLHGIPPFAFQLVGIAFLGYFSMALYAFSAKIRGEQMLGTLEAMLVSPTRTSVIFFYSAAWDFTFGAFRVVLMLLFATQVFGVKLHLESPTALFLGVALTLLSSAGVGILTASFIVYFKRGDPINFLLSGATSLFGGGFFPVETLPSWLQVFSKWVPLYWSLEVVRGSLLLGKDLGDLRKALTVLTFLTVTLLPLGVFASRFAIRRAKREGSLIQY